ncbi:hypothetical protein FFLO_06494 [Filobasidium floriforme]|uniref:Uncharacterized protein n=1 Tax=Filobasidium floriforme TaxID=5210 RepID=A0A8K0JET2_9TREE|nr:uncharacterized protein HD553DRAFT_327184 [Filobasidium floriforme]KAG7527952.1 hypothetical protein FFLO_06494 [Filobasidium floriforme]KAH8077670.1 hypothetical protein HD553DRAFT_327184 [Filobasidium floriforme]
MPEWYQLVQENQRMNDESTGIFRPEELQSPHDLTLMEPITSDYLEPCTTAGFDNSFQSSYMTDQVRRRNRARQNTHAAKFVGCSEGGVRYAMKKTAGQKRILMGRWIVEEYNLAGTAGDKCSIVPNQNDISERTHYSILERDYLSDDIADTQTGSIALISNLDWSQHLQLNHDEGLSVQTSDWGIALHDMGLEVSSELRIVATSPSDHLEPNNPNAQDFSLQSLDTRCSIDKGERNVVPLARKSTYNAKGGILKRLNGDKFLDTDGNLVNALVMQTFMDIAAFIGCTPAAISFAMKKKGVKKGIIRNHWRVEAFDSTGKV